MFYLRKNNEMGLTYPQRAGSELKKKAASGLMFVGSTGYRLLCRQFNVLKHRFDIFIRT